VDGGRKLHCCNLVLLASEHDLSVDARPDLHLNNANVIPTAAMCYTQVAGVVL